MKSENEKFAGGLYTTSVEVGNLSVLFQRHDLFSCGFTLYDIKLLFNRLSFQTPGVVYKVQPLIVWVKTLRRCLRSTMRMRKERQQWCGRILGLTVPGR